MGFFIAAKTWLFKAKMIIHYLHHICKIWINLWRTKGYLIHQAFALWRCTKCWWPMFADISRLFSKLLQPLLNCLISSTTQVDSFLISFRIWYLTLLSLHYSVFIWIFISGKCSSLWGISWKHHSGSLQLCALGYGPQSIPSNNDVSIILRSK